MAVHSDSIVKRVEGIASTAVDNDLVLLNLARNNYIGLDAVGRRIWDLIGEKRRVADLCAQLAGEFEGSDEEIRADALAFLSELDSEGLLQVADEPAG